MKQIPLSTDLKTQAQNFIELSGFDKTVREELSADYILPDTYPDVKKILRISARPVLIGRYISGRRLEINGAVDYTVTFSSDTENGETLHCVHFAGEWNSTLNDIDSLDGADIRITPTVSSCAAKLSNPRKVSIRAVIDTAVMMSIPTPCSMRCEGAADLEEELSLEKLGESFLSGKVRTFITDPLKISDDLDIDASAPAIDEIVTCTAEIFFGEARPIKDAGRIDIALKGTVTVNCVYKAVGDACTYRAFYGKIQITHTVSADEFAKAFEGCQPDGLLAGVTATPIEINASVGENNYGERRVIEFDMTADMTVSVMGGEEIPLTLDAYSVTRNSECEFEELECSAPPRIFTTNFSVSESLMREELKLPEGSVILDACATAATDAVTVANGRGTVTGNAVLSCIFALSDGGFISADASVPIRCDISTGDMKSTFFHTERMCVSDIRVRVDGDRVYFDFEVSLTLTVTEKCRRRTVKSVRLWGDPQTADSSASVTLCYPASDESLWAIAKRYRTTVAAIQAANRENARVLLIPGNSPEGFILK